MDFVVKNTTNWSLLDLLCPHSCRGCGVLGAVLCDSCKKYIIEHRQPICPYCKQVLSATSDGNSVPICDECESIFAGFWSIGWRDGVLADLVADFKYKSVRACGDVLAELLDQAIPRSFSINSSNVVIVPLPTIGKHIRERGLDHTLLLAKKLARYRHWEVSQLLRRATDTVQVGTSAAARQAQAAATYELAKPAAPNKTYLLLDDIWTTGASMQAAAKVLRLAMVKNIYGAVVAISK